MTKQIRSATFTRAEAIEESREVPLVLSSEAPVDRGDYIEVLDHAPSGVDLSRAPLPLIVAHDTSTLPVGVVDNLTLDNGRLRGIARFSKSERAQEIYQDVLDGVIRSVSVGYELLGATELGKRMTKFRWRPFEVSAVAAPADINAGFYRHQTNTKGFTVEATTSNAPSGEGRIRSLMALGDQFAKFVTPTDVRDAIDSGKSPEQFREVILNKMETRAMDTRVVGLTPTEAGRYSLARALVASITGDWTHAGFERECSRTLERTNGRTAEGLFVPSEVWGRRDFNVGTASEAGNLVPTIMRGDLFVDALRDRMVMGRLGVRILSGLSGNVDIPRKATASTLGMLSEIGSASETNPTTAKLTLQPRRIGAYVDVSKQALIQSALPLEAMLRDDLLMGAAVLIENQAMNGVGSNSEMTGLRNTANIGTVVGGSNGAALAWSHVLDLEAACANANANPGPLAGYLLNSRTLNKAKQVTKTTYLGFLVDSDQALDANGFLRLNNTRAGVSNLLPSTLTKGTSTTVCSAALYSSDWSMAVLGLFGAPDIVVDQVTQAVTGQVRVVLNQFADFGVRQPKAFAKIEDLLTT